MSPASRFIDWLWLRSVQPDLAVAQFEQVQSQIPSLYGLLIVNAAVLSQTHFHVASSWMTVYIPGALVLLCMIRAFVWYRFPLVGADAGQAIFQLRRIMVLGGFLAAAYISWSLSLNAYGGEREHAHVAIFIAVTVIGVIFCAMHLPQAAFIIITIVIVPYLVYYLGSGDAIFIVIAFNILLVALMMASVLLKNFQSFKKLISMNGIAADLNREISNLAHTDILTGLPNRRQFFNELEGRIASCFKDGSDLSLGVLDLDRFKAVNDSFGHVVGDQLLEAVGERLGGVFNSTGLVARLGGDEFAFVIDVDGPEAEALANRACHALAEPFRLGELTVTIGGSCGIAVADGAGLTARSLYDRADYALYKAKSDRRGFATTYSAEHEDRIRSERAVEAALQTADLEAEMEIHLQPIVRRGDGAVIAVEALARWINPQLGRVAPSVFIPVAERAGIIHRLTLTLFAKAIEHLDRLPPGIKLSFNLSAHDLVCTETILGIVFLVRRSGTDPSRIIVELTETAVLRDFQTAEESIRLLRMLGVIIALDDFGTGQSSLSYLHKLKIDRVKIDRSFVKGADQPEGRDLLTAVVALCHSMKMQCIAEGVEDAQQHDFLTDIGCDAFQGYFFARPMQVDALLAWHAERSGTFADDVPSGAVEARSA